MPSFVIFDMLEDRLGDGCIVGACRTRFDHKCLRNLTSRVIRYSDDSTVRNAGMLEKMSF
jgi:hypothetical protein